MVFRGGDGKYKVWNGKVLFRDSLVGDYGRDIVILGFCWDDWEGGVREKVGGLMVRWG